MGTTADKLAYLNDTKTAIKNAIVAKGVAVPDGTTFRAYADKIGEIQTPPSPIAEKDINFYDYDGTLVESWSLEQLSAAASLPDNPKHDGLIAQGWNWTLEQLKNTNREMQVGQMYITADGKTKLYITIYPNSETGEPMPRATPKLCITQSVSNGVAINWGDGSNDETISGVGEVNIIHTYTSPGDYIITLSPQNDCVLGLGGTDNYVFGSVSDMGAYAHILNKVEFGNNINTINQAFRNARSLKAIVMSNNISAISTYGLAGCSKLKHINFPSSLAALNDYICLECYSLNSVTIPPSITSLGGNCFSYCYALSTITIPDNVTMLPEGMCDACFSLCKASLPEQITIIGNSCFYYCPLISFTIPATVTDCRGDILGGNAIKYIYVKPATPPRVTLFTDVFGALNNDCIIFVPTGTLSAYQAATGWSGFAEKMQEKTFS